MDWCANWQQHFGTHSPRVDGHGHRVYADVPHRTGSAATDGGAHHLPRLTPRSPKRCISRSPVQRATTVRLCRCRTPAYWPARRVESQAPGLLREEPGRGVYEAHAAARHDVHMPTGRPARPCRSARP